MSVSSVESRVAAGGYETTVKVTVETPVVERNVGLGRRGSLARALWARFGLKSSDCVFAACCFHIDNLSFQL